MGKIDQDEIKFKPRSQNMFNSAKPINVIYQFKGFRGKKLHIHTLIAVNTDNNNKIQC